MKFTTFLIGMLAALVVAEKYAMVFGTADGWGNYSITSVSVSSDRVMPRILAVCMMTSLRLESSPRTLST